MNFVGLRNASRHRSSHLTVQHSIKERLDASNRHAQEELSSIPSTTQCKRGLEACEHDGDTMGQMGRYGRTGAT